MIEIRNCSKAFGEIHAIDRVSMEIGECQIFGLVGTNGAGKSTLLRMAAGVMKPDEGEILVDQKPVYENEKIKQQIFYISDGRYFPQGYKAADLKDFYREYYPGFMTDRYSKLMDQFHLDEKRRLSAYSKGMKKQLLVIMGISAGTKYLLCDETFDGLDPVMRQAVKSLFVSEIMNRDFTPVIASHNMRELEDVCDHVGLLHKGGILLSRELEAMAIAVSKGYGSHLIPAAGKMFLEHLFMYLLLYFGAVLALAVAGNILAGILSLCCVYLYGPVLGILLWALEMLYFRTNIGLKEGMAEKISVFLSPVSISVALRTYSGQKDFWIIIVGGILLLITLVVCAYLAYTKRPAEKTGKSFVYGFLESILLFMVVIPAALAIGTMFGLIGPEENRTGWWIFGLVLGTVVFYGILQVIFAMDFRKMAAHKLLLLLLGICVAVSAWIL